MECYELNIDGLVGPTHHYAGLSAGNLASTANALQSANPKAAALQGLAKMRLLHEMGLKQAVMPPHERPNLTLLRQCGFTGQDHELLQNTYRSAPELVSTSFSASSMWTANAATITIRNLGMCANNNIGLLTAVLVCATVTIYASR